MSHETFIQRNIKISEFVLILVLFLLGFGAILYASTLSVELGQRAYWMGVRAVVHSPEQRPLNDFLWAHNFSQDKGIISFSIEFNDSIETIVIDFPDFIDEKDISLIFFDCNIGGEDCIEKEYNVTERFIENPQGTTFVVKKLPVSLDNHKIVVEYKSKILPNGLFIIEHPNNPLYFGKYAIQFMLGSDYECNGECFIKEESKGVKEHPLSDKKDIRLQFEEQEYYWIKMESANSTFKKNLFQGFGISFVGSSMVLFLQFLVNNVKERKKDKRLSFSFRLLRKLVKYIHKKVR